jgi:hypothetical protein
MKHGAHQEITGIEHQQGFWLVMAMLAITVAIRAKPPIV